MPTIYAFKNEHKDKDLSLPRRFIRKNPRLREHTGGIFLLRILERGLQSWTECSSYQELYDREYDGVAIFSSPIGLIELSWLEMSGLIALLTFYHNEFPPIVLPKGIIEEMF